jgi:hypothetical protein
LGVNSVGHGGWALNWHALCLMGHHKQSTGLHVLAGVDRPLAGRP